MPGSGAIAWMSFDGAAVVGGPGGTLARGATVGIGAAVAIGATGVTEAGAGTAVARMQRALDEFTVVGVTTNIPAHKKILASEAFRAGQVTTHLIDTVGVDALAG